MEEHIHMEYETNLSQAFFRVTVAEPYTEDYQMPMLQRNPIDKDSILDTRLEITHLNLLDQTVEGVACEEEKVFCVQYHPESAPGPQDSSYLFEQFIEQMEGTRNGKKD